MKTENFAKKNPARISPRMFVVKGKEGKFHVVIEQLVLCEAGSFTQCLFLLLSSFYVFHMKYPDKCKKALLFLQHYVLGQPDNYQVRKGSY